MLLLIVSPWRARAEIQTGDTISKSIDFDHVQASHVLLTNTTSYTCHQFLLILATYSTPCTLPYLRLFPTEFWLEQLWPRNTLCTLSLASISLGGGVLGCNPLRKKSSPLPLFLPPRVLVDSHIFQNYLWNISRTSLRAKSIKFVTHRLL